VLVIYFAFFLDFSFGTNNFRLMTSRLMATLTGAIHPDLLSVLLGFSLPFKCGVGIFSLLRRFPYEG
jgi:hypothetical protein